MAVLPIRLFPDPILRQRSKPASWKEPKVQEFIRHLVDTLYAQPGGIGIAAPQVGNAKRIIVIDISSKDPTKRREVMINPVLRRLDGEVLSREGCMSLPEYTAYLKRSVQIRVVWQDLSGNHCDKWFEGIEAICIQHEIDHLNGMLFLDRVVSLKTDMMPRANNKKKTK